VETSRPLRAWDREQRGELRIGADKIQMGWDCRECGHSTTPTPRPDVDDGHVIERRIVEHMPLHAITALYGELRDRQVGVMWPSAAASVRVPDWTTR